MVERSSATSEDARARSALRASFCPLVAALLDLGGKEGSVKGGIGGESYQGLGGKSLGSLGGSVKVGLEARDEGVCC